MCFILYLYLCASLMILTNQFLCGVKRKQVPLAERSLGKIHIAQIVSAILFLFVCFVLQCMLLLSSVLVVVQHKVLSVDK